MLLLIDVSCLVSFDTLHFLVQSGSLRQLEDILKQLPFNWANSYRPVRKFPSFE